MASTLQVVRGMCCNRSVFVWQVHCRLSEECVVCCNRSVFVWQVHCRLSEECVVCCNRSVFVWQVHCRLSEACVVCCIRNALGCKCAVFVQQVEELSEKAKVERKEMEERHTLVQKTVGPASCC